MSTAVVIGAGLAGLVAGIRLAQGGARVTVVAKGVGGLHLSTGTIDVLGYAPGRVDEPAAAIEGLVAERPDHPYARLAPEPLGRALEWFRGLVPGLRYEGDPARNMVLPTAIGVARPTALAPASIAAGDLRAGARLAVVGFRALKDFFPALLADNVARADLPAGARVEARPLELDVSPRPGWADVAGPVFARGFDEPDLRRRLADELRARLEPGEAVAMPAVLGLLRPGEAWDDLQQRLGTAVVEVPTMPPSVPGMRLQRALVDVLLNAGGRLVTGPAAVGVRGADGRVDAVLVRDAARTRPLAADAVVLATGGFTDGGLELDSRGVLRETVAGLPVTGPPPGAPRLSPRLLDAQPLLRAGLTVDDRMRPVDADGRPVWANLHAAGAIVAGAEPWREKSGEGIAIAGGHAAASAILEGP